MVRVWWRTGLSFRSVILCWCWQGFESNRRTVCLFIYLCIYLSICLFICCSRLRVTCLPRHHGPIVRFIYQLTYLIYGHRKWLSSCVFLHNNKLAKDGPTSTTATGGSDVTLSERYDLALCSRKTGTDWDSYVVWNICRCHGDVPDNWTRVIWLGTRVNSSHKFYDLDSDSDLR